LKFKLDENLPQELAKDFVDRGHEADTVVGEGLKGAVDPVVLHHVRIEGRVLLTLDKGIADVRIYPPKDYAGLVLLRPQSTGRKAVLDFVRGNLDAILSHELSGRLMVVSESSIRLRL
jgi:predicted nuclease of predicted toxin-antitoxin system